MYRLPSLGWRPRTAHSQPRRQLLHTSARAAGAARPVQEANWIGPCRQSPARPGRARRVASLGMKVTARKRVVLAVVTLTCVEPVSQSDPSVCPATSGDRRPSTRSRSRSRKKANRPGHARQRDTGDPAWQCPVPPCSRRSACFLCRGGRALLECHGRAVLEVHLQADQLVPGPGHQFLHVHQVSRPTLPYGTFVVC